MKATSQEVLDMALLRARGLTQRQIAKKLGVTQSTVSRALQDYTKNTNRGEVAKKVLAEYQKKEDNHLDVVTSLKELCVLLKTHCLNSENTPAELKIYGELLHKYVKLLAELRGDIVQRQEVDVTTWSGAKVEEMLEDVLGAEDTT